MVEDDEITFIKVKKGTRSKLKKLKAYQKQSYDELINAVIKNVGKLKMQVIKNETHI